ncbi:MAG TPA: tripartite tricarboxylate transporter substrate binding protein [Alphaproteobacteria bacterium]
MLLFAATCSKADDYPSKPLRLVVPYPSGGANDIFARLIAQKLTGSLGKPVVIDNKPGASTMLGSEFVAKSPPDGYTLLLNNSTLGTTTVLYKKVPYKLADFAAVAPVASTGIWLTVNPELPVRSVGDLVAYVKTNAGRVNYASTGRGGATHLISEQFDHVFGLSATGVEYRGSSPLITDLMAGQVQFYFFPVNGSMEFLRNGQLRAIAVTSERRLEAAPDVPTFTELGYPSLSATIIYGIWAPAGVPAPIIERLNRDIAAAVQADDVRARFLAEGAVPMTATPPAFTAAYRSNLSFWEGIIRPLDIELD